MTEMKAEWTNKDNLSICDVVELECIKSKMIVPISETIVSEKDEPDWEIPSFMNKEKQNESNTRD